MMSQRSKVIGLCECPSLDSVYLATVCNVRDGILRWLNRANDVNQQWLKALETNPMHEVYAAKLDDILYQAMDAKNWLGSTVVGFDDDFLFEEALYQVLTMMPINGGSHE